MSCLPKNAALIQRVSARMGDLCWQSLLFACLLCTSCTHPGGAFHSDGANTGFTGAHSVLAPFLTFHDAGRPTKQPEGTKNAKWLTPVGNVLYGQPVVDSDGTVYIGNLDGELVAVLANGNIKWKQDLKKIVPKSIIVSSADIDDKGNVYIIGTSFDGIGFLSTLYSFASDSQLRWYRHIYDIPKTSGTPRVTTTSPKVVTSSGAMNILVYLRTHELAVFASDGNEFPRQRWACEPADVRGGVNEDPIKILASIFVPFGFFSFLPAEFKVRSPDFPLDILDPTVAVANAKDIQLPVVVVADSECALRAYQWDASVGGPAGDVLWKVGNLGPLTSPAVSSDGKVIIGTRGTHVTAFDLNTSARLWDYNLNEPMMASPGLFLGSSFEVYVASTNYIHALDSSGQLVAKTTLTGTTASSPIVTWDRVYLSDPGGLHSLTFDLANDSIDTLVKHSTATPTVAPDGTLYALFQNFLVAYPK